MFAVLQVCVFCLQYGCHLAKKYHDQLCRPCLRCTSARTHPLKFGSGYKTFLCGLEERGLQDRMHNYIYLVVTQNE